MSNNIDALDTKSLDGGNLEITKKTYTPRVPISMISNELSGIYGTTVLSEMKDIIKYYDIYERGSDFVTDSHNDYIPAQLRYKKARSLINKESRFLFGQAPDLWVRAIPTSNEAKDISKAKENSTIFQTAIDTILKKNKFNSNLLKATKDCLIGKRVAMVLNFNASGVSIGFSPSLEFVYETSDTNSEVITKLIIFYTLLDNSERSRQKIYRKKYWMGEDNLCHVTEDLYDGNGVVKENILDITTKFTYIPAYVIVNDGLTGDLLGESEIETLCDYESWFSRLSNADMDAERKGMNPIKWTMDCSSGSTDNLSLAAGAYWDLSSDMNADGRQGQAGVLESQMPYASALGQTLDRIQNTMYEEIDMPNTSSEALQGIITSGKTLKALYWGLIVRCNEKMLTWKPALEFMVNTIIEGCKLYPESLKVYGENMLTLPEVPYEVEVDNQYPLPEDETEEKQTDMAEVTAQTMSKRTYMKKWRGLTDDEVDQELKNIAQERQILDDGFFPEEPDPKDEPEDEPQDDDPES